MKQTMLIAVLACLAQLCIGSAAQAAFPDRPIKLVVPSPPGGPPDIMARLLMEQMGAKAVPATPDQLAAYIAEQQQRWTQIVATTHISAE